MAMNSERFGAIPREWRQKYLKRSPDQLATDMVAACDELRNQRKEINSLRGQLLRLVVIKNTLLVALVGVATAESGIEVVIVALFHVVK